MASSTSIGRARPSDRARNPSGSRRSSSSAAVESNCRVEAVLQVGQALGDPAGRHPPGQLLHDRRPPPGADLLAAQPVGDVVLDQAPHPGQLPGGGEVVHQRHVGVGRRAVPVEEELRVLHQRRRHPDLHRLEPLARREDAPVPPPRRGRRRRHGRGEVRLARVEHRRREHGKPAREHLLHLVARPPHGRGGGDEHGPDRATRAQPVDRGLVQAHHRAEGVADQVQLVLDDQVRRPQPHRRLDHAARQVRPRRMPARPAERRRNPGSATRAACIRCPPARTGLRSTPSTAAAPACPPWRSPGRASAGRSPRPR